MKFEIDTFSHIPRKQKGSCRYYFHIEILPEIRITYFPYDYLIVTAQDYICVEVGWLFWRATFTSGSQERN